jgi:hypothetical protein
MRKTTNLDDIRIFVAAASAGGKAITAPRRRLEPGSQQRMIFSHPLLRRQITEDVILLLINSSHAFY